MKTFRVNSQITISVFTDVKAETEEDAIAQASERCVQGLCYRCATGTKDEEWVTGGELDGEPDITHAYAAVLE